MNKIGIIGFGSWGTALSVLLAEKGNAVTVTARSSELLDSCKENRENIKYLPGIKLPENIVFTDTIEKAVSEADFVLFSVPSQAFRAAMKKADEFIPENAIIINAAKGIDLSSLKRLSEVCFEIRKNAAYVALSGPSHAEEVGKRMPTSLVAASENIEASEKVQELFSTDYFRVYTNNDICGVELGGALKNIMALGAGISDGVGFGDNAKAALMTRGLAEIARLGVSLGARHETFSGLSGIGDLIVTCTSMHSRNRRCGIMMGSGASAEEATKKIGMVVEGISACRAASKLADITGTDMPITKAIAMCLDGKIVPREGVMLLMSRAPKDEAELSIYR